MSLKGRGPAGDEEKVRQERRISHGCEGLRRRGGLLAIVGLSALGISTDANAATSFSDQIAHDAAVLKPIFRDGFSSGGFHDFYRGMANASNWFSIDSVEMFLGLGSALVALLAPFPGQRTGRRSTRRELASRGLLLLLLRRLLLQCVRCRRVLQLFLLLLLLLPLLVPRPVDDEACGRRRWR